LDYDEPPGRHPLPDEPELVPVGGMAAVPELVKLEVRKPVVVEAELPQAHVLEWRLCVSPRLQPVRTREAHHEEHVPNEGGDAGVHQCG